MPGKGSVMKNTLLSLILAMLVLGAAGGSIAGDNEDGLAYIRPFMDIPFGTSEKDIRKILDKEKKRLEKAGISPEFNLFPSFFIINNFPFKDDLITVCLYFDYDKKYYTFRVKSPMLPEAELDPKVYEHGDSFNKFFEERFGKPAKCLPRPVASAVDFRYATHYCEWEHSALDVFTGFSRREAVFYGYGVITDREMERALKQYEIDNKIEKPQACSGYYD
jgi:hypothetical protein